MAKEKRKILVLVEGAKTDVALMERLLATYQIDFKYEIVPYCTNIYTCLLYTSILSRSVDLRSNVGSVLIWNE